MRIHNNRKRTAGRDFQMLQIKQVVAFVVMPRFGTETHAKQPNYRQRIEVVPIDNKSLSEQSDFFSNGEFSSSKKAKLWKKTRKEAWEKNVEDAKKLAESYKKSFPDGEITILPVYNKTSLKIKTKA